MSDFQPSIPVQELLEHTQWVRELARRLTRDEAAAEDVAQSTWLAALQHPPAPGRPVRQWLAAVARNFARQSRRGDTRRGERERTVARDEALPSTADLLERASMQRKVVDAVMGLEEPYRTAILLRFFESLPPRVIAERLDVPVETVRTRLTRGIEKLRVLLDESHAGDRRTWMLLLAPLAHKWAAPSPIVGTALMNAKLVASLSVITVAGLGAWWIGRGEPALAEPEVRAAPAELVAPPEPEAKPAPLVATAAPEERSAVELPEAPIEVVAAEVEPAAAAVIAPLSGVVLAPSGQPAAHVELGAVVLGGEEAQPFATSDARGRFTVATPPESGRLVVAAGARERWVTVMGAHFSPRRRPGDAVVIVAPRTGFSGTVLDESGAPLADARVTVELPEGFRARFDVVLDGSRLVEWKTVTDVDGRFDLPELPSVEGATWRVTLGGFEPHTAPLPQGLGADVLVTLLRPAEGLVRGHVVDGSGRPIEGAQVALGIDCRATDARGAFAFELEDSDSLSTRYGFPPESLTAAKPGFLPATFTPTKLGGELQWPGSVTLTLADEPFGLDGRVLDHTGAPLVGARVWIMDATFFGAVGGQRPTNVEAYLAGSERAWNFVATDDAGRFQIDGLLDREYRMRVMDEETMLMQEFGPFQAGASGLELLVQTDLVYPRVAGRVVNQQGEPVPGVGVFPMCDAFRARARGRIIGTSHDSRPGVVTDSEGRFELLRVPRSLVYLRVDGDTILPNEYGRFVEERMDPDDPRPRGLPESEIEELEIPVEQRCHLRVLLSDPGAADMVGILDGTGRELVINVIQAGSRRENETMPLIDGRSETLAVPDTGRTVVLYLRGEEVGRMPVELEPGEVVEVTF